MRIPDENHAPCECIICAIIKIGEGAMFIAIKRIHGKIAACGIFAPIGGEFHHGMAAIARGIAPQAGNFKRATLDDSGKGAVIYSCWDGANASVGEQRLHGIGRERCGQINIMHGTM